MNIALFYVIFWEIFQLYTSPDCFYKMQTHQLKLLEARLRGIFDPVYILFVLANPRSRAAGNRACEFGEANARAGFTGKAHHLLLIILLLSFTPSCMKEQPESLPGELEWNPDIAFPLGEEVFGMNSASGFDTTLFLPDTISGLPAWINEQEVVMEGLLKFDFSPIVENLEELNSITFRVNGYNQFPHMISSQAYFLDVSMSVFDSIFAEGPVVTPAGAIGTDGALLHVGQASYDATLEGDRIAPLEDLTSLYFRATFSLEQVDTILYPFYPQLDFTVDMGIMLDLSLEF